MPDAGGARRAAERILAGPQFHGRPAKSFDPLGGFLHAIGRAAAVVFGPLWRVLRAPFVALADLIGVDAASAVLLALVAVLVGWLVVVAVQRRARLGADGAVAAGGGRMGADELERRAARAEAEGDLTAAVRLRFAAGLARLEERGMALGRETRTSRDLASELGSPSFERLAGDLEVIVYAGAQAAPEHVATSRELWPRVTEEAGHRS